MPRMPTKSGKMQRCKMKVFVDESHACMHAMLHYSEDGRYYRERCPSALPGWLSLLDGWDGMNMESPGGSNNHCLPRGLLPTAHASRARNARARACASRKSVRAARARSVRVKSARDARESAQNHAAYAQMAIRARDGVRRCAYAHGACASRAKRVARQHVRAVRGVVCVPKECARICASAARQRSVRACAAARRGSNAAARRRRRARARARVRGVRMRACSACGSA